MLLGSFRFAPPPAVKTCHLRFCYKLGIAGLMEVRTDAENGNVNDAEKLFYSIRAALMFHLIEHEKGISSQFRCGGVIRCT